MKLLIDANLSPAICKKLEDEYRGSVHVFELGLQHSDEEIFQHAVSQGYIVLTKDDDFDAQALLYGPPAKVIRVRLGNCSTLAVTILLTTELDRVAEFANSREASLLILP